MSDLLPCPCCGGTVFDSAGEGEIDFWCDGCSLGFVDIAAGMLAETWNTRAPQWQPIETAPPNKSIIFGGFITGNWIQIIGYIRPRARKPMDRYGEWRLKNYTKLPTHWAHTLQPPEETP